MSEREYCTPAMLAMRSAPGAAVCIDEDCELSGYYAHVGPCEPCDCPLSAISRPTPHAIAECPRRAGVT